MKFLLRFFLFVVIFFIILLVSFSLWLKTEQGILMAGKIFTRYIENKLDFKYKIKIKNLKISLLLFQLKVEKLIFLQNEKKIFILNHLYISMVPSLSRPWKGNVKELIVKELILIEPLDFNLKSKKKYLTKKIETPIFVTQINKIDINNLVLSSKFTGFPEAIIFNLKADLDFNLKKEKLFFLMKLKSSLQNNMILANKKNLRSKDILINNKGYFDCVTVNLIFEEFKVSSIYSEINGNFIVNFLESSFYGSLIYDNSGLEGFSLLSKNNSLKSLLKGKINFTGFLSLTHFITKGQIFFENNNKKFFYLPKINWEVNLITCKKYVNGNILFYNNFIKANGKIGKNSSEIYLKDFFFNSLNLNGKANLSLNSKKNHIIGELKINSENINQVTPFFPYSVKGNLNIKIMYKKNTIKKEQLNITGKINHLFTSFVNCDFIAFSLSLTDFNSLIVNDLNIKMRSLGNHYGKIKSFNIEAKKKDKSTHFALNLESVIPNAINLKVCGQVTENCIVNLLREDANFSITNNIDCTIGKIKITTPRMIKMTFKKGFSVLVPELRADNGKLNFTFSKQNSQISTMLNLTEFPFFFNHRYLYPVFYKSLISGNVSINGTFQDPLIKSKLKIYNITLNKKDNISAILTMVSQVNEKKINFNLNIKQKKKQLAELKLNLYNYFPLLTFNLSTLKKSNLNANFLLTKEIDILSLIPLPIGHKMAGYLDGKIEILGNIESLIVNSNMTVTKGKYEYQLYGTKLKDISGKILVKDNIVSILNFMAHDNYFNTLEASGKLVLSKYLPFNLNTSTERFNFVDNSYIRGTTSGNLSISGNSQKALAKGSFYVGPTEINIPEYFTDNIPVINIIRTVNNNILNQDKLLDQTKKESNILDLDINLNTKKQVYVRGRGLTSLLAGSLKITGNINSPNILGELKSLKGRYQEFGKVLNVKKGIVRFNGPISSPPYLNIVGTTNVGDIEIRLILDGSILAPDIKIESTPPLSQQDALSLLLFGKNLDNISANQAISLAKGMQRLSGSTKGFDPLSLSKRFLGIDDISIEDDNKKNSYLRMGKYLTDKVYWEIEQGNELFGTKSKLAVELTPEILFEATTGLKCDSTFGISWSVNY